MKRNHLEPIVYSLLIIIGILIGSYTNKPTSERNTNNQKINGVLDLIRYHYVDTIKNAK